MTDKEIIKQAKDRLKRQPTSGPCKKIVVCKNGDHWCWEGRNGIDGRIFDSSWRYTSQASATARARRIATQLGVPVEIEDEQ